MSRWLCWRHASIAVATIVLGFATPPAAANPAGERGGTAVLAVTLDGAASAEPVLVRRDGDRVWMRAADLRAIGLPIGNTDADVSLDTLSWLTFAIDEGSQTIALTRTSADPQRIRIAPATSADPVPITPNGWGAVVNYDTTASASPRTRRLAGTFDATLFTPQGYAFANMIAATGSRAHRGRLLRLDTGYTLVDPDRLLRATVGDFVNAGSTLSRPIRMAGLKLGTDFSVRPDLVTFPTPTISTSAALPSAVDLIVNGNRRAAGDVRAGQFAVSDIPVVTGVNTVTVAVRDALGRETLQTLTTYASRTQLRRGLASWSIEGGAVRTGFAGVDDRYRAPAASGTVRYGATDRLTIEAHGEAGSRVAVAGVGASVSLGSLGMIDANAAASDAAGVAGHQVAIGFERVGRPVSMAVRYTAASKRWRDLAARYGSVTRAHSLVMNLGLDLGPVGTLGISAISLGRGHTTADTFRGPVEWAASGAAPTTFVNASYSARLADRINLVGNVGADLRRSRSLFASFGALVVFGSRSSGYAGATMRGDGVGAGAEFVRSAVSAGDVGYRASVSGGTIERVAGSVDYLGTHGHVEAQIERTNGASAARVSARGAVILADGGLFAADTTIGSFAVVDTAGQRGVSIFRDNRLIGVTDRRGRLLVPNLNPFQPARFSIDPTELGNDIVVAQTEASVRPMERAGVRVVFDLAPDRAVMALLVDESGAPLPPGSRASVGANEVPVGIDGLLYLPDTPERITADIRIAGGAICRATFDRRDHLAGTTGPPVRCVRLQVAANDTEVRR